MTRRALNIPIEQIVVMIERNGVSDTARELGCDRGYIYKMLHKHNLEIGLIVRPMRVKQSA